MDSNYKKSCETDRLQVIFAHISTPVPSELALYAKPSQIANEQQQRKWYARRLAHFLLHQLFERNGLDCAYLAQIERTASGRPFIRALPQLDFNISHSGDWVGVALYFGEPSKNAVGVDMEHPQKQRNFAKLIHHYANEEEIAELGENPTANQFYLSWCLREAVLKAQGVGIVKLSTVRHLPVSGQIFCEFCPKGTLYFYQHLPFYLALFAQSENVIPSPPTLYEWKENGISPLAIVPTLVYSVN